MDILTFDNLKRKYGRVASWAIWSNSHDSDTSDISMFNGDKLFDSLKIMHSRFIFVALNISGPIDESKPFGNFHGGKRDFMLRDAIKGTELEGAYMTDIIKFYPDKNAPSVTSYFKKNPQELDYHFKFFLDEINAVGASKHSVLVALGNDAYTLLLATSTCHKIIKLTHYAAQIKKSDYRNEVKNLLANEIISL